MTRLDELQKKYPTIPRDVILKHDVLVQGIRDNEDLDKVSEWRSTMPGAYGGRDFDGNLQEVAEKTPWRLKAGQMLRPKDMRFRSGLGAAIYLRSTSPYTVRDEGDGKFALCEGEEKVDDIYFLRHRPRTATEPVTSRGTPISRLIDHRPCCFFVIPVRSCEYFSLGKQCKFCNFNPSREDVRAVGLDVPATLNLDETVEAYKIRSSEVRLVEGGFVMGGFMEAEQEAKLYRGFIEKIASAAPYKPNLTLHTEAMERKDMQRLRDAGVDAFVIQVEVMDPKLFPEICPGKATHMPYERWIEAFHDAVDVFGVGNAGGKFVPGVTLLATNGHKTWQEARDYQIEAHNWQIKNGLLPAYLPLWWSRGSVYAEDRANLAKFPPTEFYLEVVLAHHEAMTEYGLYEKMNKFMHCALDCTTGVYGGDMGMLTLAGDVGRWMSDVVPDESNWLAKFIASVESPARSE